MNNNVENDLLVYSKIIIMGENMRTVCTMEDAEEIDILGDFDYKSR